MLLEVGRPTSRPVSRRRRDRPTKHRKRWAVKACAGNVAVGWPSAPVLSHPRGSVPTMDELTDTDREILRFSGVMWNHRGAREDEIVNRFAMSVTAFWQRVHWLIDQPAAELAEPVLAHRHQRIRDERRRRGPRRG